MGIKVIVPETLDDITVGQYQRLSALDGDPEFVAIKTLEILMGVTPEESMRMKTSDREMLLNHVNDALKEQNTELKKSIRIEGTEYGLHPYIENMSYGEFVDIKSYENEISDAHRLMAVFYRPIIKKKGKLYDIIPYGGTGDTADLFKSVPLSSYMALKIFFYNILEDSLDNTLKSSLLEKTPQIKHPSSEHGDGTLHLMSLLKGMSYVTNPFQNLTINSALHGWHIYRI